MKNRIRVIRLTGFIMLSFMGSSYAQTHNKNLHRTVTHSPKEAVINRDNGSGSAAREPNAQENQMPQKKHTDMDRAKYVQSFVNETMYHIHEARTRDIGLPDDFHYNMAQWTQRDVTEFAKGYNTFDTYEILLGIANTAVEKDKNGKYTQDALDAQAALQAIKPDGCKSWKGFCGMIADAADASQTVRDNYRKEIEKKSKGGKKTGAIIDATGFSSDIAVAEDRVKAIDPKTAFAAAGGVISSEQAAFDEKANAALARLKADKGVILAA